jgi:hypothetical protein
MVWEGRYDLYRRLVAHPDLQLESTDFQNFHDAQSSSPMGKLLRVDSELQNLMAIDPATSTAIQSYDAQLQSLTSQLNDLDGQLAVASTLADTLQLMADRQVLLSSLAIVSDNLVQVYESLGSLDLVVLNNIRAINASFTSSHPVEQTAQQVYQLLFDFLEDKSTLDNPTDLLELRTLAELCPFTHGHYIYMARAMMQHFDESFEVVTETCSGINLNQPPPQAFTKDQATGGLTVYPNPSKDEIKVSCDTGREIAIIVVKDLNGRELWRGDFESATSIDISDWADGIYFLSVMQLGKPTQTIRFTCLR